MYQFKKFVKKILNKGYYPPVEFKCRIKYLGSGYGGWAVPEGYITRDSIVYSFGVGEDISFDLGLIERFGVVIHAFDPTPKSVTWINAQQLTSNFKFQEVGLANFDGNALFIPPENPQFVSYKMVTLNQEPKSKLADAFPVKRLATIMSEMGHTHIDILKMDIEGAEYDVINDMQRHSIRPKILLAEFHHRWPEFGLDKTRKAMGTLRKMGYQIFYVSARDEFGFLLVQ